MRKGDLVLLYLVDTGFFVFVAASEPYEDWTRVWPDDLPYRIKISGVLAQNDGLKLTDLMPILKDKEGHVQKCGILREIGLWGGRQFRRLRRSEEAIFRLDGWAETKKAWVPATTIFVLCRRRKGTAYHSRNRSLEWIARFERP